MTFLSGFQGHPVWINFWGSWCPPCQAEFPAIEDAYHSLTSQGLVLLAISLKETMAQAQSFARAMGGTFPIYNVPEMTDLNPSWDVRNFPTHLYIDRQGVLRKIVVKAGTREELINDGEWLIGLEQAGRDGGVATR